MHQFFQELSASLASSSRTESLQTSPQCESLLFVDGIADIAEIEEAVKYRRLRLSSGTSKSAILGAIRILSQCAFLVNR